MVGAAMFVVSLEGSTRYWSLPLLVNRRLSRVSPPSKRVYGDPKESR